MKETRVKLKLENLYGGDGFERPETVKEVKLERTDKTVRVRKDIGVPIEREMEEHKSTEQEVLVNTFKRGVNEMPLYRLGGSHGKLWGALREAGYQMYQTGELDSKIVTDRVLRSLRIDPQWVLLEIDDSTEIELDVLPQQLSGRRNAMIELYFDVIPKCDAEVTLKYPEEFEDLIMKYLDRAQTVGFGNKRRGALTVLEKEEKTDK